MTYSLIILYNITLLLYLLSAGGRVTILFSVALPLRLVLFLSPWVTALFLPHTLFIPVAFLIGVHLIAMLCVPQSERNSLARQTTRLWRRLLQIMGMPLLIMLLCWGIMHHGCQPCHPINAHRKEATPPPRPLLLAHRGCGADGPENTLAGFEQAVQMPSVHGIETDIHISLDGVPFLLHDRQLVRTTNMREKCPTVELFVNASALNYSSGVCPLKDLNVGAWFNKVQMY